MKLGLAQVNTTVGDLEGNVARCLEAARRAGDAGADLILFPEMTVPGYPPRDILYDESFVEAAMDATEDLARRAMGLPPLLIGSIAKSDEKLYNHPSLYNAAYLIQHGRTEIAAIKRLLPVYDVFYEPRWFVPGRYSLPPIDVAGTKVGVLICEDLWDDGYPIHPAEELKAQGAQILMALVASPFRKGVLEERKQQARRTGLPIALVNLVGATDELIFDGRSFVISAEGQKELAGFQEDVGVVDLEAVGKQTVQVTAPEEELYRALVLGVRDFARKNGMKRAFVGLSGGIDSSVTAVLAAEALGRENISGIAIPSRYTDDRSTNAARELAKTLGIGFEAVKLEALHRSAEDLLGELAEGAGGENLQARLRMVVLMSYVNRHGGFLINTSNKTELALGYTTLYGDMAGAISPLGDVTKPEVYALARWINASRRKVIPKFVMERKPSAELRPGQVDPFHYDTVAPEMEKLVNSSQSNAAMRATEHKRWQMGVVLRVSGKAFGRGRMMPITRK